MGEQWRKSDRWGGEGYSEQELRVIEMWVVGAKVKIGEGDKGGQMERRVAGGE